MKMRINLLFLFILLAFTSQAQFIPAYVPKSNLELWYTMNNGSASDSSGNLRDGALSRQNKTIGRHGCPSSALEFSHDGDSLGVHYGSVLLTNQFTISFWSNANTSDTSIHGLVSWNDSLGGFQLGLLGNQLFFDYNKFGTKVTATSSSLNVGLGTSKNWHHYVLSYNLGLTEIYIDTLLKAQIPGVLALNPNANIIIGNSIFGEYADGSIEDFGWWSKKLNMSEIKGLYFNQGISGSVNIHNALCSNNLSAAKVLINGSNLQACTYSWIGGNGLPTIIGTGDSITTNSSDSYLVNIYENSDRCLSLQFSLNVPSPMQIQNLLQTAPRCYGDSNAMIIESVNGGTLQSGSNYQITWSPAVSLNDTAYNLPQGVYVFSAMDDNGCVESDSISIVSPQPLKFAVNRSTEPSCVYSANGNLQAIAGGGTAPYYYVWGSSNGPVMTYGGNALYCPNGIYTVYVTDAHNCFISFEDTFNQQLPCIYPVNIPPYMSSNALYAWYPFNGNTLDESGLMNFGSNFGGTYVSNRSNCSSSAIALNATPSIIQDSVALGNGYAFNLNQFTLSVWLQSSLNPTNHLSSVFSNLNSNGFGYWIGVLNDTIVYDLDRHGDTINLINTHVFVNPNKPNLLTFSFNNNIAKVYLDSALTFTDSSSNLGLYLNARALVGNTPYGEYYSGVLDDIAIWARELSLSEVKLLYNYSPISASGSVVDNVCGGAANGSAQVSVNFNGNVPSHVDYQWTPSVSTTDSAINLYAGNYQCVVVADYANCATVNFTVNQPTPIQVIVDSLFLNQPCAGESNGFVSVHAGVGGIQPYSYVWSNGVTTQNIGQLSNGSYSVLVTDANNCHAYDTFNVVSPEPLQASINSTLITCGASNDASIQVSVNGGVPMYNYVWQFNTSPLVGNDSIQQNLAAGIYTCIITDVNICSTQVIDTILAGPAANFVLVEPRDTMQYWTSSLSLSVTSNAPVNYQWQVDSNGVWINCHDGYRSLTYAGINSNYLEAFISTIQNGSDRYRCILSDSLCSDTTRTAYMDFEFEGINEVGANHFYQVYWNDATHQLVTINSNYAEAVKIELRNTVGQLLLQSKINQGLNVIPVEALNDGLYIISVLDRNAKVLYNTKLIK